MVNCVGSLSGRNLDEEWQKNKGECTLKRYQPLRILKVRGKISKIYIFECICTNVCTNTNN